MKFKLMQRLMVLFGGPDAITCAEVKHTMQSYIDGEVDVTVARRVTKHLGDCVDCEAEVSVFRQITISLQNHPNQVDAEVLANLTEFAHRLSERAGEEG